LAPSAPICGILADASEASAPALPGSTTSYLVRIRDDADPQSARDALAPFAYRALGPVSERVFRVSAPDAALLSTALSGFALSIEPEGFATLCAVSVNDPWASQQWALTDLHMPDAWTITEGSASVRVAVIDTGVTRLPFDDLGDNILDGWDFVAGTTVTGDVSTEFSTNGHGTTTTGIIAAMPDNDFGGAGLCFQVEVLPLQVFQWVDLNHDKTKQSNELLGYEGDITDAIYYAADHGCDVINLSLGSMDSSLVENSAVQYAVSKGCIVVAAAGNMGTYMAPFNTAYQYPASFPNVVSVGAHSSDGLVADFSTYNDRVDVSAPGVGIGSTTASGSFSTSNNGTSFASPQVAGIAALAKAVDPDLNAAEFMDAIRATSVDKGDEGYDVKYGYGNLQASALLTYVAGARPVEPPIVSPLFYGFTEMPAGSDAKGAYHKSSLYYVAPRDGTYRFASTDATDTDVALYADAQSPVLLASDSAAGPFSLSYTMTAGQTIVVSVKNYDGTTLALTVSEPFPLAQGTTSVTSEGFVDTFLQPFTVSSLDLHPLVYRVSPDLATTSAQLRSFVGSEPTELHALATGTRYVVASATPGDDLLELRASSSVSKARTTVDLSVDEAAVLSAGTPVMETLARGQDFVACRFRATATDLYRIACDRTDAVVEIFDPSAGTFRTFDRLTERLSLAAGDTAWFAIRTNGTAGSISYSIGHTAVEPLSSTVYALDATSGFLTGLAPGLDVATLLSGLDAHGLTVEVLDASGAPFAGTVGTGCRVRTSSGGVPVETYTVVLYGDVSGEGSVSALDLLLVKRHLLGLTLLDGTATEAAADVDHDNAVNLVDLLLLKRNILGLSLIAQSP